MKTFSVFTSDLSRRPELRGPIMNWVAEHSDIWEVSETVSPDGKITTFAPVMA